jgi:hypothetical protein
VLVRPRTPALPRVARSGIVPDDAKSKPNSVDPSRSCARQFPPLQPGSFLSSICDSDALLLKDECCTDGIECALDVQHDRLVIYVHEGKECTMQAESMVELTNIASAKACTQIVVYIRKTNEAFADWLRRFLYHGFTLHRQSKTWESTVCRPGFVMCALDLQASSASDTGGSAVTGEDTDIGSDCDSESDSDDDADIDGHAHLDDA